MICEQLAWAVMSVVLKVYPEAVEVYFSFCEILR